MGRQSKGDWVAGIADTVERQVRPDDELKRAQRAFFIAIYQLICGSDTGPRIPTLLLSLGEERVKMLLRKSNDG